MRLGANLSVGIKKIPSDKSEEIYIKIDLFKFHFPTYLPQTMFEMELAPSI